MTSAGYINKEMVDRAKVYIRPADALPAAVSEMIKWLHIIRDRMTTDEIIEIVRKHCR